MSSQVEKKDRITSNGISFDDFAYICIHKLWIVILCGIIGCGLGYAIAKYAIAPQYSASSEVLIEQRTKKDNNQIISTQQDSEELISTYKDLITSQSVLRKVKVNLSDPDKMNKMFHSEKVYSISLKKLKKAITVINTNNSQMITITVTTNNAKESEVLTNMITDVFKQQANRLMNSSNIAIISRAHVPNKASFPNLLLFTSVGAVIGVVLSAFVILMKQIFSPAKRLY